MEIKTCEQYVVSKVIELENKVEEQQEHIFNMANTIKKLKENLDFIGSLVSLSDSDYDYIKFDSVWKRTEPGDYERLCEMFNIFRDIKEE